VRTFRRRTSRLTLWTGEAGGVERAQAEVGASHDDLFACRRQLGWPLNCADNVRSPGTTNETGGSDCGRWRNVTVAPGAGSHSPGGDGGTAQIAAIRGQLGERLRSTLEWSLVVQKSITSQHVFDAKEF